MRLLLDVGDGSHFLVDLTRKSLPPGRYFRYAEEPFDPEDEEIPWLIGCEGSILGARYFQILEITEGK